MTSNKPSNLSDSLVLFSSDDDESDSEYELKQHKNLTVMLKGVPPPSSITISKFTIEEILQKYHENKESFGFGLESCTTTKARSKKPVPFLKYSNSSSISEIIASLIQKVQERYVQMETMSSWNICIKTNLESCSSAKKRLRMGQSAGLSPSRRLSHLARRRQFFSSANLKRLANAENIRQIEIRRNRNREDVRRNIDRTIESEKLKSSKRALFMSPESGTPTKYGNSVPVDRKIYTFGSDEGKKLTLQERSKKVEVLKWLSQQNFEVDFPRKRLREECANHSDERKRKCPRRSLNFADDDTSSNVATSDSNNSADRRTTGSGKLSELHKNKLLWAVSVVLRENKISQKDEHFKNVAAKLFFKCRTNLDEILSLNVAEGTSDKILYYARKILPSVLEKLGIHAKLSFERSLMIEKSTVKNACHMPEDSKENNAVALGRGTNCVDDEVNFVFKTPKKVSKKRMVKSCQKVPNSGKKRKKSTLKRWRSLELLIENAVQSSMMSSKTGTTFVKENNVPLKDETNFETEERIQSVDMKNNVLEDEIEPMVSLGTSLLTSSTIKNGDCINDSTFVLPSLPCVDTSVIFSPIPSSVSEENENILSPSLRVNRTNPEESEVLSDENDSVEILNQDEDLKKRIHSVENFSEEYLKNYGEVTPKNEAITRVDGSNTISSPLLLSPIENTQNLYEITQLSYPSTINVSIESSASREIHSNYKKEEESFSMSGFHVGSKTEIDYIEKSEKDEDAENNVRIYVNAKNDELDPLTENQNSKTERTYKPRKLIVKKSKPNWKVVRKNSEEAESESELRLKMRLSHEWEIICRNSSCSDIGNNSECDAASLNCSQTSNATDKEVSSENEVDNSSIRSSALSKLEDNVEEEITKSSLSFRNINMLQTNESNLKFNLDLSSSDEKSKCSLIVEKDVPVELSQTDNSMQSYEVDNSVFPEESFEKTHDNLKGTLNEENNEYNIEMLNEQINSITEKEPRNRENEDEELKSKPYDEIAIKDVEDATGIDYNCEKEKIIFVSDKNHCKDSSIFFIKRLTKTEKLQNCGEETGIEEKNCNFSKQNGSLQWDHCDDENRNSSTAASPEKKKKSLTLENYKARKLETVSKELKSEVSNNELVSKDVSSDGKSIEGNTNKKIYNIRLKPMRHHKYKYKDYSKERKKNHDRERYREKAVSTEDLECQQNVLYNSDTQLPSLRQFLNRFCENNSPGKVELNDSVKQNMPNLEALGIPNSSPKEVNVQTIVDALTKLSNLVKKQIKLEGDKMTEQMETGGNGLKKSKWLEVVSSWCGKNLNSLSLTPNIPGLSFNDSDNKDCVALKKESELSSLPETIPDASNYPSSDSKIKNEINCLKTDQKPVKDIVRPFPSVQINADLGAVHNNENLIKTCINSSQNSIISNCVKIDNNAQIGNFQNYPIYSGTGSLSRATSFSATEQYNMVLDSSVVNDYRLSGDNSRYNNESEISCKNFNANQNHLVQPMKDPRRKMEYTSESLLYGETSASGCGELPEWIGCRKSNLINTSNYGDYSSSLQGSYQFNSNYLTAYKSSLYQPNLYENYPIWQIPNNTSSLNYHQSSLSDGYQNSSFYPFQMSNVPYYFNKY